MKAKSAKRKSPVIGQKTPHANWDELTESQRDDLDLVDQLEEYLDRIRAIADIAQSCASAEDGLNHYPALARILGMIILDSGNAKATAGKWLQEKLGPEFTVSW